MQFDPVAFYRAYPSGGNSDRGNWLRRCLDAMCMEHLKAYLQSRAQEPVNIDKLLDNRHRYGI